MGLLRGMFGPSKEEVWGRFASTIGGRFEDGGFWGKTRVTADVGEWTVTLDTYTVSSGKHSTTYTRLRAPYVNPDGFRFNIRRKVPVFDDIGRLLGGQDVEVGHRQFDEAFIIQGTDPHRLRRLFDNPEMRRLLEAQPDVSLQVKDDEGWFGTKFPDGVDELYFRAHGIVRDEARLRALFDLFSETLETLCKIGSAYERDPRLTL